MSIFYSLLSQMLLIVASSVAFAASRHPSADYQHPGSQIAFGFMGIDNGFRSDSYSDSGYVTGKYHYIDSRGKTYALSI